MRGTASQQSPSVRTRVVVLQVALPLPGWCVELVLALIANRRRCSPPPLPPPCVHCGAHGGAADALHAPRHRRAIGDDSGFGQSCFLCLQRQCRGIGSRWPMSGERPTTTDTRAPSNRREGPLVVPPTSVSGLRPCSHRFLGGAGSLAFQQTPPPPRKK
jgi:hypothetical protein